MPRNLKIYLIDDSMELCQDLQSWLSLAGHEVVCSTSQKTLVHSLLEYQPHLIVLGLARYVSEGMELFRRISNHRQLHQIPTIIVSDDASLEYEMLDAFDFQVRPVDRERLLVCLKHLSRSRGSMPKSSFTESELKIVKDFLLEHSGLHFNQHNQRILVRGLLRRIQALRMESLPAYYSYLTAVSGNYDEVNKLLGLLTIGETSFFRYRAHREALVHTVMPRLVKQNLHHGKLRMWSAGCSTGEEPYSLAILLCEYFPEVCDWDIQILGTDINKRALRQAREGLYGERSLRMMEPTLRERYFRKVGSHFLLDEQVRRMVHFDYLNLQVNLFPAEDNAAREIDLLSCRNVLIYFELDTIRRIVEKFSRVLKTDGYLFLGHAETMQSVSSRFQRHHQNNAFFYQLKVLPAAQRAAVPGSSNEPCLIPTTLSASKKPAGSKTEAPPAASSGTLPDRLTAETIPRDPDQLYREAVKAFEHERFAEAYKLFERLLEQQPCHPQALVGKGLLLANQGRYSDARICCARAIRADDLLPEAYLLRGLILDMEGFLARALVEYQKVLWLKPDFVMAHYLAAKVHGRLNDSEKKQRSLRNTIRALEQADNQSTIPFSGGLSRGAFLEIAHGELADSTPP